MSNPIATAVKHMLAAGMDADAVVAAVADMESKAEEARATADADKKQKRSERNRRYYQSKKAKKQDVQTDSDVLRRLKTLKEESTPLPLGPPLSPTPPNTPYNPPHPEPSEGASAQNAELFPKDKPKPKPKQAYRLPEDWELSEQSIQFAQSEGLQPEAMNREFQKFRDHWLAASGANARKRDWDATWRNWVRRATEARTHRQPASQNAGNVGSLTRAAREKKLSERADRLGPGTGGVSGGSVVELRRTGDGSGGVRYR